jgi:hypothetical protein
MSVKRVKRDAKVAVQTNKEDDITTKDIIAMSYGTIKNIPVKTEAYSNWLAEKQKINPFIGKYAEIDEESTVEDKILSCDVVDGSDKLIDKLSKENDELVEIGQDSEAKFIEFSLIENVTKANIALPASEISEIVDKEVKKTLGDSYKASFDSTEVVEKIKNNILIESDKQ